MNYFYFPHACEYLPSSFSLLSLLKDSDYQECPIVFKFRLSRQNRDLSSMSMSAFHFKREFECHGYLEKTECSFSRLMGMSYFSVATVIEGPWTTKIAKIVPISD